VVPNRPSKSSGSESTYPTDLNDLETIRREIMEMAEHAAGWLDRRQLFARTVTIKVRYSDFSTVTRSHTAPPTRDTADVVARALQLLTKTEAGDRPIRLLGVSVHNVCGEIGAVVESHRLPFPDHFTDPETGDAKRP
jgi:DNA polymerase-4